MEVGDNFVKLVVFYLSMGSKNQTQFARLALQTLLFSEPSLKFFFFTYFCLLCISV